LGNFFTDVLQRDERFHSRKPLNDLDLLEPVTRSLVQQVIQEAGTLGISLMAFETYRSQDRKLDLFDQDPVPGAPGSRAFCDGAAQEKGLCSERQHIL